MIVTINHPNWTQDELIEGAKDNVTFTLERMFTDKEIRGFMKDCKVGNTLVCGNYTIEVFEL